MLCFLIELAALEIAKRAVPFILGIHMEVPTIRLLELWEHLTVSEADSSEWATVFTLKRTNTAPASTCVSGYHLYRCSNVGVLVYAADHWIQ